MTLRQPESMEDLVYFTDRDIGRGRARVWVFRQQCPKCGKAVMGKPLKPDGKPKIRADSYECPKCSYAVEKWEYEETLSACVEYTCPSCGKSGEMESPFKRKKVEGVDSLRLQCPHCKGKIDVTKKMKEPKNKAKKEEGFADEEGL